MHMPDVAIEPFLIDPAVGDPFDPATDRELATLSRPQPARRRPVPPVATVLAEMVQVIVDHYAPQAIVLFGSQARGSHDDASDIDLLVVLDRVDDNRAEAVAIGELLFFAEYAKDIYVTSPDEIAAEREDPTSLVTTALREGKLVYDRRSGRDWLLDPVSAAGSRRR
jgi:predicted nucleotidyltransferase